MSLRLIARHANTWLEFIGGGNLNFKERESVEYWWPAPSYTSAFHLSPLYITWQVSIQRTPTAQSAWGWSMWQGRGWVNAKRTHNLLQSLSRLVGMSKNVCVCLFGGMKSEKHRGLMVPTCQSKSILLSLLFLRWTTTTDSCIFAVLILWSLSLSPAPFFHGSTLVFESLPSPMNVCFCFFSLDFWQTFIVSVMLLRKNMCENMCSYILIYFFTPFCTHIVNICCCLSTFASP